MIAIYDVLIHLSTAVHVVRFNGQHLLQGIRSTVCFQCPHFHLTEALTTELSFTTQRLLSNQTVRACRTSVHLVVNQVVQFQHVHVTHGNRALKCVTRAAIEQSQLT
ncbi:Uncharacterised protein [Vibrio cholerae]|uniref:Uncharacterized protein n=1 Tax=Vibrio cholerae TaxID=666 RepID=A0A656AUZ7_VIBCL|nr:Uncharacterised protein [Vibrio cholerae]CSC59958.1 Uncharacterised protein [Vibrio cholerae]CSC66611.1 Uncharacterised protein [Vibrio cholerae]CSD03175.1 Uncharacterised protein [Vibrio cholerae]CSD38813.1 Uncharacterised protein [Vibrio cholerae]